MMETTPVAADPQNIMRRNSMSVPKLMSTLDQKKDNLLFKESDIIQPVGYKMQTTQLSYDAQRLLTKKKLNENIEMRANLRSKVREKLHHKLQDSIRKKLGQKIRNHLSLANIKTLAQGKLQS